MQLRRKEVGGRRLHVGCGQVYKPGYVNVDKYDLSVADEAADALDLPYPDDSFESVSAEQLVEHFDRVHCRYLFAELYRVLEPGGELAVETPDLERSMDKLLRSDPDTGKGTLDWIFGQDSPGLQHKTGFTWDILKAMLESAGFEGTRREKERSHTYEPGIRATCRKPRSDNGAQMASHLRKNVLKRMDWPDSYILVPLEDTVSEISKVLVGIQPGDRTAIVGTLSRAAAREPRLGLAVLDTLSGAQGPSASLNPAWRALLEHLVESGYKGRAASLWARFRKDGTPEESFREFASRLEGSLRKSLESGATQLPDDGYFGSLDRMDIEAVDLRFLLMRAHKHFFIGVKKFQAKDFTGATEAFNAAKAMDPWNPATHWNLARLNAIDRPGDPSVRSSYETVLAALKGTAFERAVAEEADRATHARSEGGDEVPISEYNVVSNT